MEDIQALLMRMPPEEREKAEAIARRGGARLLGAEGALSYAVREGEATYAVTLPGVSPAQCNCQASHPCPHIAAALLDARHSGQLALFERALARRSAERLRALSERALPCEAPLALEVTIVLPRSGRGLGVMLRTGTERLYVVRSVALFLSALQEGQPFPLGKQEVALSPARYAPEDRAILTLLGDIALVDSLSGQLARTGRDARLLPVPERFVARLLERLAAHPFVLLCEGEQTRLPGIPEGRLDLLFALFLHGREIKLRCETPAGLIRVSADGGICALPGELLFVPEDQRQILQALPTGPSLCVFTPEEAPWVLGELLPRLRRAGHVTLDGRLEERMVNRPLSTQARLYRQGSAIACEIDFCYGDVEVHPFSRGEAAQSGLLLVRDAEGEGRVLRLLSEAGFIQEGGRALLTGSERIWRFFTEGLEALSQLSSVYLSEEFRAMRPRRPRLSGHLGQSGTKLRLELSLDDVPTEDTQEILEALRARRRFFRMTDGTFLDLSGLEGWEQVADAALEPQRGEIQRGPMEIRAFRASYLLSLLGAGGAALTASEAVRRRFAEPEDEGDIPLSEVLRPYQRRGFLWLRQHYRLGLGGVLADEMGLGKTLQVIALLRWSAALGEQKPSIIVSPTSLVYNWQQELSRFAPELGVVVAEGTQGSRAAQLAQAREASVYLTSYPLLRRDIEALREIPFRFAILDEAQSIKNASSMGAGAARSLSAEARFALTGTPMENHPGELWSIFDFALPGYLGSFSAFMARYGAGGDAQGLRARIRPFLLRRLKQEVASELPEKTEAVLMAEMTPEQARVYRAALQRLRPQEKEFTGAGRFRALSALTELRECCDHPQLILPDYVGGSGKMELLLDLLPGVLASGHRVLLFSQFTRMLRILERRLTASGVECFYLDGETPGRTRIERVNRFNAGEGQVFLISLKAGGSGLNLTGADWVIHYDPWWNPAVEDQATDRAHRIGQERAVMVARLITRGTVEEQVARLSERKRALFERMIEAGESFPTQLSDEEIRALFSEE